MATPPCEKYCPLRHGFPVWNGRTEPWLPPPPTPLGWTGGPTLSRALMPIIIHNITNALVAKWRQVTKIMQKDFPNDKSCCNSMIIMSVIMIMYNKHNSLYILFFTCISPSIFTIIGASFSIKNYTITQTVGYIHCHWPNAPHCPQHAKLSLICLHK